MVTNKQLSSIIINAIIVKMLLSFPRNIFVYCANSAWLAAIYSTAIAFGLFSILKKLYRTKDNVIGMADKVGGTTLRIITLVTRGLFVMMQVAQPKIWQKRE